MIGAWRATPAAITGAGNLRDNIFPSGRQALSECLRRLGLGRVDRVAVPEWSSACVLSAVAVVATPVPMREARDPAAVLVYDQWGWARSFAGVRDQWPRARIVHDCVDTADLTFSDADVQVWSLSKVLGLGGGGLARLGDALLGFAPDPAHRALCRRLEELGDHDIAKTHVHWLTGELERIASADIAGAYAAERDRRRANLAALGRELPDWMAASSGGPGLYPLLAPDLDVARTELRGRGIECPIYHFDFAGDPLRPDYRKCLALPLHGELTPAVLASAR